MAQARRSAGRRSLSIPSFAAYPHADALLSAIRVEQSRLPVAVYDNGIPHGYVLLERPDDVAALQPDLQSLARLARETVNRIVGFNVCAGAGTEWKRRMFAPADRIAEDPAAGSAAGSPALHLARHGLVPWGAEPHISQGAEVGRPSTLFARAIGDGERVETIEVSGNAVLIGGGWFDASLLRVKAAGSRGASLDAAAAVDHPSLHDASARS